MGRISKSFPLLLIVFLAASSLIMAKPAFAQTPTPTPSTIPTPSVPTFTIQLAGPSYTVPTTYSLNQSSGQIVAKIGYYDKYSYIVLTIKNQPFAPTDSNVFYYNVQNKEPNLSGSFDDLFSTYNGGNFPTQSTGSDYTNLSFPIGDNGVSYSLDYQVQAMIGYIIQTFTNGYPSYYVFVGQTSAWSSTQTISIPASIPLSPTSIPSSSTSTPTLTSIPTLTTVSSASYASPLLITTIALIVIAFLLAIIIFLLIYMRKRKPINSSQQTVSNDGV